MKIIKIIQIGIDILSPIQVYSDSQSNIKNILRGQCEGRCLRGCRVDEIKQIIKISECVIDSKGPDCDGRVFVRFEVEATVFSAGEVINGCTIVRKDKGLIVAVHPSAAIMMPMQPTMESVKTGQIIPVRVAGATYDIGSEKVSVSAYPYLPSRKCTAYYIEGTITAEDKDFLANVLDRIEHEQKMRKEEKNQKAISFFSDLIHPFEKTDAVIDKKSGGKSVDLLKLISGGQFAPAYYCRNPRLPPTESNVVVYENPPVDPYVSSNNKVDMRSALLVLLEDYCDNLRIVREFLETYPPDLVAEHKNIWRIFVNAKKAPVASAP